MSSMVSVLSAQEILLTTLRQEPADVLLDTTTKEASVLLDAELIKFYLMVNAAASLDSTQSMASVVSVIGTKSMMKVLEFAEFPAIPKEFSIYKLKAAYAYHNISHWLMDHVRPANSTQPIVQLPKLVSVIRDISRILDFALLHATPMSNTSTELASVKLDTI
jgi:hypothetical protein